MSEQRTMRERLIAAVLDYAGPGETLDPGLRDVADSMIDAILAELRDPSFDMIEAAADQETAMRIPNRQGREDWSSEEIAEAMLRAAIDAIRGEGENAVTKRPGEAQGDDAVR